MMNEAGNQTGHCYTQIPDSLFIEVRKEATARFDVGGSAV